MMPGGAMDWGAATQRERDRAYNNTEAVPEIGRAHV